MSQGFKLKFDKMRESNPAASDSETSSEVTDMDASYPSASNVRNLGFAWPDGRRMFINYTYLVSGEYDPAENKIDLLYTTHAVVITGVHLETLFNELMGHLPKMIACMDRRYNETMETNVSVVNEIIVTSLNA